MLFKKICKPIYFGVTVNDNGLNLAVKGPYGFGGKFNQIFENI